MQLLRLIDNISGQCIQFGFTMVLEIEMHRTCGSFTYIGKYCQRTSTKLAIRTSALSSGFFNVAVICDAFNPNPIDSIIEMTKTTTKRLNSNASVSIKPPLWYDNSTTVDLPLFEEGKGLFHFIQTKPGHMGFDKSLLYQSYQFHQLAFTATERGT